MANSAQHHCSRAWYLRPPVWIIGIVLLGLAAFGIVEMTGRPAATPYGVFLDQLDAGNIASVTFQGTQINGRFKHPIAGTAASGAAPKDTFRSQVPDFGDPKLLPELRKEHVAIDVASSSSWARLLAGIPLPMLLLLGFIVVAAIIRFMRGGKADSASAMPMHPMQGMIGLVSGLFGKQSQGENPPTHDGGGPKNT
jgi:FtsH Extracellular